MRLTFLRKRILATLVVLGTAFSFAGPASATTLQDLDQVLIKAGSLQQFLGNQALINEYYELATQYYGGQGRFPRESYNAILGQMRVVLAKFPDLANRAWETNLGQPFKVVSEGSTYGKNLDQAKWDEYQKNLVNQLEQKSHDLLKQSSQDQQVQIRKALESLDQKIRQHEMQVADKNLKKADLAALNGQFYQSLKNDPAIESAASLLVLQYLDSKAAKEVFESGNPDLILNALKNLKDQPKILLKNFESFGNVDRLASAVKNLLPDAGSLVKDANIFPQRFVAGTDGKMIAAEAGTASEFSFVPSPRRFHAFFKGMPYAECVGGWKDKLDSLTPERWATIILRETQFHYVEKGGKFQGWVQAVPIQQNGTYFASVDFASPSFSQSILVRSADGSFRSESLVNGWLHQAMQHKPANWKGFVVSQSNAINNGGALPAVRSSPSYILGEQYAPQDRPFAHADPETVKILTNIIPLQGYGKNYGGSMIFDASVKDAGTLTALKIVDQSLYEIISDAIKRGDRAYVESILEKVHSSAMSHLSRELITLREANVLKILTNNDFTLPNRKVAYSIEPKEYFDHLITANFSLDQMKQAQAMICHTVDDTVDFTKRLLNSKLVHDAKTFVRAVDFEVKNPSVEYKTAIAKLVASNLENFLSKNPSQDQLLSIEKFSGLWSASQLKLFAQHLQSTLRPEQDFLTLASGLENKIASASFILQYATEESKKPLSNERKAELRGILESITPIFYTHGGWGVAIVVKAALSMPIDQLIEEMSKNLKGPLKSETYFKYLIDANFSLEQMKKVQAQLCNSTSDAVDFTKLLLSSKLVHDAKTFVKAVDFDVKNPSEEYKTAISNLLATYAPKLPTLYPDLSLDSLIKLENLSTTIETATAFLQQGLSKVQSASDFLRLFENAYNRGNDKYKAALSTMVANNLELFLSKNPSQDQLLDLEKKYSGTWNESQQKVFAQRFQSTVRPEQDFSALVSGLQSKSISARLLVPYVTEESKKPLSNERKAELRESLHSTMPNLTIETGWGEAFSMKTALSVSVDQLVEDLVQYPKATGSYAKAIADVRKRDVPRLLSMNPSLEQTLQILKSSTLYINEIVLLTQRALEKSTTVLEFASVMRVMNTRSLNQPDTGKKLLELLSGYREKILSLSDLPTKGPQLAVIFEDPKAKAWCMEVFFEGLRRALQKATTAEQMSSLLLKEKNNINDQDFQNRLAQVAKNSYEKFAGLKPEASTKNRYKSAFFSTYERFIPWMIKKEAGFDISAPKVPKCEMVYQ